MRFNNDSGSNYSRSVSEDAGSMTNAFSANGFQGGSSPTQRFFVWDFINIANRAKVGGGMGYYTQGTDTAPTSGNQPILGNFKLKWANNTNAINRVDVVCTAGSMIAGSEIIVLGHD